MLLLTLWAFAILLAVVLSRTDCALMPVPEISKMLYSDINHPCLIWLVAPDRSGQASEFTVQNRKTRLKLERISHVFGFLQLGIHRITVSRRLYRHPVQAVAKNWRKAATQVLLVGPSQARLGGIRCFCQLIAKSNIRRFEIGCIGINQIVSQDFSPPGPELKRTGMDTQCVLKTNIHSTELHY